MVNGESRYIAFSEITDTRELGLLLSDSTMTYWPMFDLGRYWTGEVAVLWTPPESFEPVLRPGDQSPFVAWVADAFAELDGQPTPLARQTYNQSLEQRVILFQNQNSLNPDGIVGVRTVLKLNDALASDFKMSQWRAN
jgi:general secretion pathway protein A